MSKLLILLFLVLQFLFLKGQVINEIKDTSIPIRGRIGDYNYDVDNGQYDSLKYILTTNVFNYYGLKQYDSPLKKKLYQETEDYKVKLSLLNDLKQLILSKVTYILDFEPAYPERKNNLKYNLDTKTFTITNSASLYTYFNNPDYMQLDEIVFKIPKGVTIQRTERNNKYYYNMLQKISFKIEDELLALKIEENKFDLRFLFVFKFKDVTFQKGEFVTGEPMIDYILLTNLEQIILYNSKTDEIYFSFK